MLFISAPLTGSIYYFIHGSFEMYPTPEQQEKARIVAGIFIIIFSAAETALFFAHRFLKIDKQ
jgi:hypothetical protein